jgi:hypothetical protein
MFEWECWKDESGKDEWVEEKWEDESVERICW